jgi:hypothetical protein
MRITPTLVFGLLCICAAGCGEPSRYEVKGIVTINGKPAALTHVIFLAVKPATPTSSGGSTVTDNEGAFIVTNGDKTPGLMAGDYKVIFQQTLMNGKPILGGGRKKTDRLPGETEGVPEAYLLSDTTPVTVTVKKNMEPLKLDIQK